MNLLEIIYMVGAAAIGLIIGMVIEYVIDFQIVIDIQTENRKLRLENEQLKQEAKKAGVPIEIIEIVDNRVGADVDYSQNW